MTKSNPLNPVIKVSEYQTRRKKVLSALKGAVGVVFAGAGGDPLIGSWRPNRFFEYLTGIRDEPGASVLFDPTHPDPNMRISLVLKPLDPELERWDGLRDWIGVELNERYGFSRTMRSYQLPRFLSAAARRSKRLACLHPFADYTQPVSPDLKIFQDICARTVGVSIEDRTDLLIGMRAAKSSAEQRAIKAAGVAYKSGLELMLSHLEPGVNESRLAQDLLYGSSEAGGVGYAFNPIVGSGLNATVLHYNANDQECQDGDLLLVDCGTTAGGYACDVTRVFPVSGRFTKRQKELYSIVLKSYKAAVRAAKPGATLAKLDQVAKDSVRASGFPDAFPHGLGHHMGLDVHDVTPDTPLKPGHVITIEPGLYIPEERVGIRLEDDFVITERGCRNLTSSIPIEIEDVEKWMKSCRPSASRTRGKRGR